MSQTLLIKEPVSDVIEADIKKNNEFLMLCNFFLKKLLS